MLENKENISYIEPVALPGDNAHSMQIENNLKYFNDYSNLRVFSYGSQIRKFPLKHIKFNKFFKKQFLPYNTFYFLNKLKSYNFSDDYIYTRSPLIALYLRNKSKKIILEIHDIPSIKDGLIHYILFKLPLDIIPMFFLKYSKKTKYVTISNGLKKELIKKGFNKDKIIVLPDGANLEVFKIKESSLKLRKELNLPLNKKLIIYTGSFQNWKGYDTLLESSKSFPKNSQLVMVGGSEKEIKSLSKKYPNVIFTGFVKNTLIPKYLKCSDILVIPNSSKFKISSHYTSPLKLFEYMASNKAIIASDLPSIREICSNKEVLYFQADNSSDLSLKVRKLLNDKVLGNFIAKNSYLKVKGYTWEKRVEKILQFYKK